MAHPLAEGRAIHGTPWRHEFMHNLCTDRTSPFVRHDPHLQIHPPRAAPAIELSGISLRGHAPLAYPVEIPKHVEDCLIVCIKCPMWLQEACEPIRSTLCSCSWGHGRGLQSSCRCRSSPCTLIRLQVYVGPITHHEVEDSLCDQSQRDRT